MQRLILSQYKLSIFISSTLYPTIPFSTSNAMSDTEKPTAAAPEKTAPSSTEADLTKYKVSTPRRPTLVAIKKT